MSGEPPPIAYAAVEPLPPSRWGRLVLVPALCLLVAWLVGTFTNGVNGVVSPAYFRAFFRQAYGPMYGGQTTWGDVVAQGLLESTAFGLLLAVAFTLAFALSTGCRATIRDAIRALAPGLVVCLACWLIGGVAGMAWTTLSPQSFRQTFRVIVITQADLVRWGFVGGSIWGVNLGGLLAIVTACVGIHLRWRRSRRAAM